MRGASSACRTAAHQPVGIEHPLALRCGPTPRITRRPQLRAEARQSLDQPRCRTRAGIARIKLRREPQRVVPIDRASGAAPARAPAATPSRGPSAAA
jgi:hypothetical protein